jgi:L-threonylcarbamoyladenylate synthase
MTDLIGKPPLQTKIISILDPLAITSAIEQILQGGLVAFPTDTVYGLGATLDNSQAIEQLFVVKGRESAKAIAVLVGDVDDLTNITPAPNRIAERLAERFWPGPLTLVVARSPHLPVILSPTPTIGVRMPDHPGALQLLRLSGPLAVTSANLSGGSNTTTAQEVYDQLKGQISLILDGGLAPGGQPSTVADCLGDQPVIIRQGPIHLEALLGALT